MFTAIVNFFKKEVPTSLRFLACVVMAFASFGSFCLPNSVLADKLKIGSVQFGNAVFIVIGTILGIIVLDILFAAEAENKADENA
jgi:hypothetical protein